MNEALTSNALTSNGLVAASGLSAKPRVTSGVAATPEGRELLTYVVRCALPADQTLSLTVGGVDYEFTGLLGLLPQWIQQPLSERGEEILSACLLAHVNHFGVSVPLSIRNPRMLITGDDETDRYISYEGTFYGNLFSGSGTAYVCSGDAAPSFEVSYPDHDRTAGDRLLRRCTDERSDGSGQTECGFVYVGACRDICDIADADGHRQCWTGAGRKGERFEATMSTWLLAYDDSESVWSELYDEVYGP